MYKCFVFFVNIWSIFIHSPLEGVAQAYFEYGYI